MIHEYTYDFHGAESNWVKPENRGGGIDLHIHYMTEAQGLSK